MTATVPRTDRDPLLDIRPGDRWLVAVAHPDDESFGCGSLIARAAARGADVVVACATRGEAGETAAGSPDRGDLAAVREAELHRASARLGASRVELLGYRDSGFVGETAPGTLCAAPVADVAGVLRRLVAELAPDVVIVLDGSDGHRDHLHVRAAMQASLAGLGGAPALYEHCLPNSLMRRWLDEMRSSRPDTAYHAIDPADFGRPDADVTHVVDVADVLDRREAAIAEHRSQSSPYDGLSNALRTAFLSTDHLVRVPPPALPSVTPRGGPAMTMSAATIGTDAAVEHRPEPARLRSRPLNQYWDHRVARWTLADSTADPIPTPRRGD
jgi:N-acetyl-1-D-myo-inositol-2-amino-2-deoxy-alpha-D-glucopyranoside deacetylase